MCAPLYILQNRGTMIELWPVVDPWANIEPALDQRPVFGGTKGARVVSLLDRLQDNITRICIITRLFTRAFWIILCDWKCEVSTPDWFCAFLDYDSQPLTQRAKTLD